MADEFDDSSTFQVVVNDEGQHSIWRTGRDLPAGWRTAGRHGTRDECLAHITEVWTDITPLSARRRLDRETA